MDIFHYCNLSKFENILTSKKLWLTPAQTMNDGTEVDHLYNVIFPQVKEKIFAEAPLNLLNDLESAITLIETNSKLRIINMPYCICFSDDGDLLPQWCRYADDGTGFSIGFDFNYFKIKNEPPHPNTNIRNAIGSEAIIYDYNLQASILYNIIKQNLFYETPNASHWITVLGNLTRYSAIFKNKSFRSEQEKRIIYYFDEQHANQFRSNFLSGPYNYNYQGVGYSRFELSWFTSYSNHAITKIFLGPKCQQSPSEILRLFDKSDIQIKENQILKSVSSYR